MAIDGKHSADGIRMEDDRLWEQLKLPRSAIGRLDPGLRSVLALLFERVGDEEKDWYQLEQRAGIRWDPGKGEAQYLPLLLRYDWKQIGTSSTAAALQWLQRLGLEVASSYFDRRLPASSTARIAVRSDRPEQLFRTGEALLDKLADLLAQGGGALHLELPGGAQPFGVESIEDIGLPPRGDGMRGPGAEDGFGVIIGIIDDGCAFAHPNFLRDCGSGPESRVLFLWDQGQGPSPGGAAQQPGGFTYGRELTKPMIDAALAAHASGGGGAEDAVYRALGYVISDLASHGTHVMDIAAGNGRALTGMQGVAPSADIIFVQLPAASIERGGALLDEAIKDGVRYVFDRAGTKPAVVNISYGGHLGPHNGEGTVEQRIDEELGSQANRAVVVAAGNGFAADCHAGGSLPKLRGRNLRWIVKPEDPSANTMEIWYDAGAELLLTLATPAGTVLAPVPLGTPGRNLTDSNGRLLGTVDHQQAATPSGLNRIRISLNPTGSLPPGATTPLAPWGTWRIRLRNVGNVKARWDAWIERDTAGRPGGTRRMQSHFHPDDADPRCTLGSYATGKLSLVVGGYNTATQQVCRYSACGPTRDRRPRPDVMAPAEEDAAGRGILSAAARSAMPRRMSGTSAAAPQVAGFVALLYQAATAAGQAPTAADIRNLVLTGASKARSSAPPLRPNAHIDADSRRRFKQGASTVRPHLTGSGKVNWPKSRELLP
jgi:hypothetical protein